MSLPTITVKKPLGKFAMELTVDGQDDNIVSLKIYPTEHASVEQVARGCVLWYGNMDSVLDRIITEVLDLRSQD